MHSDPEYLSKLKIWNIQIDGWIYGSLTTVIIPRATADFARNTTIDTFDAEQHIPDADKNVRNRFSQHRHHDNAFMANVSVRWKDCCFNQ